MNQFTKDYILNNTNVVLQDANNIRRNIVIPTKYFIEIIRQELYTKDKE